MHRPVCANAQTGVKLNPQCSPCINRYLTKFLQIGRHMGDCRPKTCFWHIRLDNHAILSGKILSGWHSVGGHYLQGGITSVPGSWVWLLIEYKTLLDRNKTEVD